MRKKPMSFKKYRKKKENDTARVAHSEAFKQEMIDRRSVREYSENVISESIIENIIQVAASAPSGANKEPWFFSIIKDKKVKSKIRKAAEKEEKSFYTQRAPQSWLDDLNKFGTDWNKEFLENAPYLIVVFKQIYDLNNGQKYKNYYVNESVGIACGFLLAAIHKAGLVALTHTPSPMGFLEEICNRPKNERAYLLIPVGLPADNARVPILKKKTFSQYCEII
jgi:nitroreductase